MDCANRAQACCIYLAVKNGFRYIISDFPPLLIQLNHAVVLTVVVVFQGLGLADVPKRLWYSADHVLVLKQLRFSAVSAHDTMTDRKSKLRECVAVLVELRDETSRWSDEQDSGDVIARVTQLCLEVRPQSLLEEVSATTPRSPSTRFSNVFGGDHRRFLRMTKHERIEHLVRPACPRAELLPCLSPSHISPACCVLRAACCVLRPVQHWP